MLLKLTSLVGLAGLLVMAWLLSQNRRLVPWRTVFWGLGLQFLLALVILRTEVGRHIFELAQKSTGKLIGFSDQGAAMVFGPLAKPGLLEGALGPGNGVVFFVTVAATIILVASLSSLFYHLGILQRIVRAMAWVMQRTMGTSGSESLCTAANIFMGMTEAPLLIRPYLATLTRSELLAVMTSGMATIAGGVFALYVRWGTEAGRADMAGHLLTASVMSAPAALLVAKLMLPETEESVTSGRVSIGASRETTNSLDALCRGASEGAVLTMNVIAMMIAFVAVVAMANYLLGLAQRGVFTAIGAGVTPVTLQDIFGWINAPFACLMGVAPQDWLRVGQILGERIVLNEFIGYISLADMNKQGLLDPRSFTLATYALCGFANFGSIAIQIGGIGSLVPDRRSDLARLGVRSMIGGLLASYMTATVVGILI